MCPSLLASLVKHDTFMAASPPKSSGREYYGTPFVDTILGLAAQASVVSVVLLFYFPRGGSLTQRLGNPSPVLITTTSNNPR